MSDSVETVKWGVRFSRDSEMGVRFSKDNGGRVEAVRLKTLPVMAEEGGGGGGGRVAV